MSPVRASSRLDGLRALRHRNFRLFWSGQLISLVGTWMQAVAQGWLVLTLTNDPFMLGLVAAAQFVPVMVFGLFGGIVADSLPKRRTLIATQSVAMTLAFILAALTATGTVQVWQILVLALALGCSNAVDMPTRQSFVIEMVGREDIGNAVALNSAIFNAARIVGPAVAGLTIGVVRHLDRLLHQRPVVHRRHRQPPGDAPGRAPPGDHGRRCRGRSGPCSTTSARASATSGGPASSCWRSASSGSSRWSG